MPVNVLRKARAAALQVLYEVDCTGHLMEQVLERTLAGTPLPEEGSRLVKALVEGVEKNRAVLDAAIQKHAPQHPVDQLSAVDRNILRIAIFEILLNNEVPPKVAINEAVQLSKLYGSLNIHRFINGVLGSVLEDAGAKEGTPIPGGSSGDRL